MDMIRQVRTIGHIVASHRLITQETAVQYTQFKTAGFNIDFVTEKGNMPECDSKMLTGMTQKLLVGPSYFLYIKISTNSLLLMKRAQIKTQLANTIQRKKTWRL